MSSAPHFVDSLHSEGQFYEGLFRDYFPATFPLKMYVCEVHLLILLVITALSSLFPEKLTHLTGMEISAQCTHKIGQTYCHRLYS